MLIGPAFCWRFIFVLALLSGTQVAMAKVALPHIFGDHMVLQAGRPLPVWGTAEAGEAVTVSFAGQSQKAVADAHGKWSVTLKTLPVSAVGGEMTIVGSNTITFRDVLVGEVWICSGQSNMQFKLASTDNAQHEEAAAATDAQIRFFTLPNVTALEPREDCDGAWEVCTPETAAIFSAVGYHFGRELRATLKVPIGLIDSSWGGTMAESWTSGAALTANMPELNPPQDKLSALVQDYEKKYTARRAALAVMYDMEDDLAGAAKIADADFDDEKWKTMPVPATWETQGLPGLDGVVWFRKTITVPDAWAGKDVMLHLGPIDEVDNTFCNGALVDGKGKARSSDTRYWNIARNYRVPGRLIKAGKNTIAVRIFDTFGAGGIAGAKPEEVFAELADGSDKTHIPLAGEWRYDVALTLPPIPKNPAGSDHPGALFNTMINPLIPYGIAGVIWYQGESNADRPVAYRKLLPTMINDWRTRWGEGDFPFLVVQLANFMARGVAPEESGWAELREAQAMASVNLKNVGLALAIDVGDADDIHPKNKKEVGRRLSLAARAIAYKQDITYSGPAFDAMKIEGGKAVLSFKFVDKELVVKGETLNGFAIRGDDGKYVWAQAKIDGEKVVVWSEQVPHPAAVRYGWANNPDCNLYNAAGLPAVPFRTDVK